MSRPTLTVATLTLLTLGSASLAQACGDYGRCEDSAPTLSKQDQTYIANHRAQGPSGLVAALADYDEFLANKQFKGTLWLNPIEAEHKLEVQWQHKIAQIAAQRDAHLSRLYWHTDLTAAKQAAKQTGKPILSLRMLGRLTDEYSCANSRFFRTTLYTNQGISEALRSRFILHWQSVRPVPKVTIDFGDGRQLHRTLTGNSAHYILNAAGQPLDVLPGLYSPQSFTRWLDRVEALAKYERQLVEEGANAERRQQMIVDFHKTELRRSFNAWENDLQRISSFNVPKPRRSALSQVNQVDPFGQPIANAPTAEQAAPLATTKYEVEAPLLAVAATPAVWSAGDQPDAVDGARPSYAKAAAARPMLRELLPADIARLDAAMSDPLWLQLAKLHQQREKTMLDPSSVALIRREHQDANAAMRRSMSKAFIEDPILALVRKFEDNIALDTVKNEYQLHSQIHRWFISGNAPSKVDQLNEKVYAELFLTPSTDPWLGLAPADVYTALDDGGKFSTASKVENKENRPLQ